MIETETALLAYLDSLGIPYQRIEHEPVYTCAQADVLRPELAGMSTKNLFLRDGASSYYLVLTACDKRLDWKALAQRLGIKGRLAFGSEAELLAALGLTPGAVTVLALINDTALRVQLVVDEEVWQEENFLCHPLVNTATLVISKDGLLRFLEHTRHEARLVRI